MLSGAVELQDPGIVLSVYWSHFRCVPGLSSPTAAGPAAWRASLPWRLLGPFLWDPTITSVWKELTTTLSKAAALFLMAGRALRSSAPLSDRHSKLPGEAIPGLVPAPEQWQWQVMSLSGGGGTTPEPCWAVGHSGL